MLDAFVEGQTLLADRTYNIDALFQLKLASASSGAVIS
jgi:hypothetical protein